MLNVLVPSLADGLLLGFVYGTAAMGLSLIWGVMNVINLAHGAVITLGMFAEYLIFSSLGLHPYLALVLVGILPTQNRAFAGTAQALTVAPSSWWQKGPRRAANPAKTPGMSGPRSARGRRSRQRSGSR